MSTSSYFAGNWLRSRIFCCFCSFSLEALRVSTAFGATDTDTDDADTDDADTDDDDAKDADDDNDGDRKTRCARDLRNFPVRTFYDSVYSPILS